MNPIIVIFLAVFAIIVLYGRAARVRSLKAIPYKVIAFAVVIGVVLMLMRGLWQPAIATIFALILHYFKGNFSLWTAYLQQNAHTRGIHINAPSSEMTKEQAYQILGLEPGESREAVRTAYRRLMKKMHPDQGGSVNMAIQLNLARDILLS